MYSHKEKKTIRECLREIKCSIYDNTIMFLRSQLATHENYFSCGKEWYQYARLRSNAAYSSERVIELPLVMKYVNECAPSGGKILEVGNVLNHYYSFPHEVVDKYEKAGNVINKDILDFSPSEKYDLIVSISTLEHVGFDEEDRDKEKVYKAIEKLKSLVVFKGKIIVTVPLGHNISMDNQIILGIIKPNKMHLMHRVSCENEWVEESLGKFQTEDFKYGSPYPYANWVLLMIIEAS